MHLPANATDAKRAPGSADLLDQGQSRDETSSVRRACKFARLSALFSGHILELRRGLQSIRRAMPRSAARPDHGRGAAAIVMDTSAGRPECRGTDQGPPRLGRPGDDRRHAAQQRDTLEVIDLCHAQGKPVAVGGPAVTSTPQVYASADFRVLGEAEGIIDQFIAAWEAGAKTGIFEAEKFTVDVTKSPVPRFELLTFHYYLNIGVQFSRGCPFTCEFCDIIELYGRLPRAKTKFARCWRSSTRCIGWAIAARRLCRRQLDRQQKGGAENSCRSCCDWLERNDYPFEFTTEASVNLSRRRRYSQSDERGELCRRLRRHRKSRSDTLGRHAEEAEHKAEPGREHSQNIRGRIFVTAG